MSLGCRGEISILCPPPPSCPTDSPYSCVVFYTFCRSQVGFPKRPLLKEAPRYRFEVLVERIGNPAHLQEECDLLAISMVSKSKDRRVAVGHAGGLGVFLVYPLSNLIAISRLKTW